MEFKIIIAIIIVIIICFAILMFTFFGPSTGKLVDDLSKLPGSITTNTANSIMDLANKDVDNEFCNRELQSGNKCLKRCVLGSTLDNPDIARTFCNDDYGLGYDYSGNKSRYNCPVGQAIASCKQDTKQYNISDNCVMWNEAINKTIADTYCINDHGPGWISEKATGNGCPAGFGKIYCKYDENSKRDIKSDSSGYCKLIDSMGKKCFDNCVLWTDVTDDILSNTYCRNDHGEGWYAADKIDAGCIDGQGKRVCKRDSRDNRKLKNPLSWIDANNNNLVDMWCKNEHGQSFVPGKILRNGEMFDRYCEDTNTNYKYD